MHGVSAMPLVLCPGGGDFLWETYGGAFAEAEDLLSAERFVESLAKAEEALAAAGPPEAVADAVRLVVKGLVKLGQQERAQRTAKEQLAKFRAAGQRLPEAKMLMSLAEASGATEGKAKAEAVSSVKEARSICRSLNEKEWEAGHPLRHA